MKSPHFVPTCVDERRPIDEQYCQMTFALRNSDRFKVDYVLGLYRQSARITSRRLWRTDIAHDGVTGHIKSHNMIGCSWRK